jgi:hypothetical protein
LDDKIRFVQQSRNKEKVKCKTPLLETMPKIVLLVLALIKGEMTIGEKSSISSSGHQ